MKQDEIVIQVLKNGTPLAVIDARFIPDGATFRECYETVSEFIVCGQPRDDDETHDCDVMGCSSVSHVLCRLNKVTTESEARNE
jgi:hypothetical protein